MRDKIGEFFTMVPTALAGLALAIASLGWSWENIGAFHGTVQITGALIASLLLAILSLKFLLNPSVLKEDIAHYMKGSMVPTFAMTTMVIASSVNYFNHQVAVGLWLIAIIFHLFFFIMFIYYRIQNVKFEHLLPSWFIPPIGIAVATISLPQGTLGTELQKIATISLQFGFVVYALMLPILIYRCFRYKKLTPPEQPTLAIFATPASLLLVGYLAAIEEPNYLSVILLSLLALSMTLFVYYCFKPLLRLPFTPAYAAFTFPLVMGATAMFKVSQFLQQSGSHEWLVKTVQYIAYMELFFATGMVLYVCARYLEYFKQPKSC
ncbi:TDT family transporter [Psychromonas marina]|nr:TDT family transporter [Psychromonas marina]